MTGMGKNRQNNKGSHISVLPYFLSLLAFFFKGNDFPLFLVAGLAPASLAFLLHIALI